MEILNELVYGVDLQSKKSIATMLRIMFHQKFPNEACYAFRTLRPASVRESFLDPKYSLCNRSEYNLCFIVSKVLHDVPMHLLRNANQKKRPSLDFTRLFALVCLKWTR